MTYPINTNISHLGACCAALSSALGPKVFLPNTDSYNASVTSYYSLQNANLQPLCIVSPSNAEDISTAITILTSPLSHSHSPEEPSENKNHSPLKCPVAIRSGGHAYQLGASNINGGITLDLSSLNDITLSEDHSTVSISVGATWGDVYSFLEPYNLSVAGGRAAQVGVGGLTLGGGISYFSPRYGWTCDGLLGGQVVLGDEGRVVTFAESDSSDGADGLLKALRGGGNNFGVVTKVDMRTFEQGAIWGGMAYYSLDTVQQQLKAFERLNTPNPEEEDGGYDEYASLITSFGFANGQGGAVVNSIVYTKDEENPAVFKPFLDIPMLDSSLRVLSMSEMAKMQGSFSVDGKRELSVATTHTSTLPILQSTYHHWNLSLAAINGTNGINWSLSLEPLPASIYARAAKDNALGFDNRHRHRHDAKNKTNPALVITLLSATWEDEADDEIVRETARALFAGIEDDARRLGAYDPFVYMNYAAEWQDPIASYGEESVEFLNRVSREVDPRGVFGVNGVPGGFKIPGDV